MRNPFRRPSSEPEQPEQPEQPRQPTRALTAEDEDDLREVARELVQPGFTDRDEVVLALEDYLEDVDPVAVAEAAARITSQEWARRAAELAAAPGTGDYARLAAAFEALESEGVLARMAFTCCNTCGTTEIDDERTPVEPAAGSSYGFAEWAYTFFHQQDAERLGDPESPLYLTYSAFRPAPGVDPADLAASRDGDADARRRVVEQTDRIVGELVRDALVAQGLEVTWDGSPTQRIQVAVPDWRKPLPVD